MFVCVVTLAVSRSYAARQNKKVATTRRHIFYNKFTFLLSSLFLCSLHAPTNTHKQLVTPWPIAAIIILTPASTPTIHHLLHCHQNFAWRWFAAAIFARAHTPFLKEYSHHQNSSKLDITPPSPMRWRRITTPERSTASATNTATTTIANAPLEEDNHTHVANIVTSKWAAAVATTAISNDVIFSNIHIL